MIFCILSAKKNGPTTATSALAKRYQVSASKRKFGLRFIILIYKNANAKKEKRFSSFHTHTQTQKKVVYFIFGDKKKIHGVPIVLVFF